MGLGHEIFRLGADKLLLQHDNLGALWLLHLEPLNLIDNLVLVVAARLDAPLGVPYGLEQSARVVQVVRICVLKLAHLAEDHADLVGDIADGIVARLLAPFGELRGDGDALARCGLVGRDEVVLRLDEAVELAG